VRPHCFLCEVRHPDLPDAYGDEVFRRFFEAVLSSTPDATFELRAGDLLIHNFSYRLTSVEGDASRKHGPTKREYRDDKELRVTLTWDFVDSAGSLHSTLDKDRTVMAILSTRVFCVTASDLHTSARDVLDSRLRKFRWYLGLFEIDLGNPILRHLTLEGLIPLFRYDARSLYTLSSAAGMSVPTGDFCFSKTELLDVLPLTFPTPDPTERGLRSLRLLNQRGRERHEERVARALIENFESGEPPRSRLTFAAKPPSKAIVEEKLKNYVLNELHPTGSHKAKLFRSLLGITVEDWSFLAEQLTGGLDPLEIEKARQSDHGVQYHCDLPVVGRNGAIKIVRTAWIITPTRSPRLTTAYILANPDEEAAASETIALLAKEPSGPPRWEEIYSIAHRAGLAAADEYTPTPMILSAGSIEPDGLCGFAIIELPDGRTSFARWLRKTSKTGTGRRSARIYYSHDSQSVERAEQFANAFARVLRLNGITCSVRALLD
jgi:hypothetical protein